MKKQIISIGVALLALAVQAGPEKGGTNKECSSCCSEMQTAKPAKAQATTAKSAKTARNTNQTSGNRSGEKLALQSPKAVAEAR